VTTLLLPPIAGVARGLVFVRNALRRRGYGYCNGLIDSDRGKTAGSARPQGGKLLDLPAWTPTTWSKRERTTAFAPCAEATAFAPCAEATAFAPGRGRPRFHRQ